MSQMTKEELREDPVLERIQWFVNFAEHNARWIALGAVIVVVVIVGSIMLDKSNKRSEAEAEQFLRAGQTYLYQGNYVGAESELRMLLESYAGSHSAIAGRIAMGDALYAQGRAEEAVRYYEEAAQKTREPLLQAAAYRGLGTSLESLDRYPAASIAYEKASGIPTAFQNDDLLAAGRSALRAGDAARAELLLQPIDDGDARRELKSKAAFYRAQAKAEAR